MTSNGMFVAAAFTATWIAMLGYLVHLRQQVRRARAALEQAGRAGAR
jgi:CcmD family protein